MMGNDVAESFDRLIDLRPLSGSVMDLDQYFGLWAVEEIRFQQMLDQISRMDLKAHVQLHSGDPRIIAANVQRENLENAVSIAVVDIQGTLTKRGSSFSRAGAMVRIRQEIRNAARDPEIHGIVLRIDSPGGTVAGTADLAREVAAAAAKKPVFAFAEDLTASAAYWIASQAEKIYANDATAEIGSIGIYAGLYDVSAMAAMEGVKAVLIKSGKFKGIGFPGTEITEEQKAYWQEIVDKTQKEFSAVVAAGRKLPLAQVNQLADGRVFKAADAVDLGLIDGIQSFDQTLLDLAQRVRSNSFSKRKKTMSEELHQVTPPALPPSATGLASATPAGYKELKAALPGADAEFIASQLETDATIPQAQTAWMAEQGRRLAAARAEASEVKAAAAIRKPGVDTLGNGPSLKADAGASDPIVAWNEALQAKIRLGLSKPRAVSAVVHENPELHQAYLAAYNEAHKRL